VVIYDFIVRVVSIVRGRLVLAAWRLFVIFGKFDGGFGGLARFIVVGLSLLGG